MFIDICKPPPKHRQSVSPSHVNTRALQGECPLWKRQKEAGWNRLAGANSIFTCELMLASTGSMGAKREPATRTARAALENTEGSLRSAMESLERVRVSGRPRLASVWSGKDDSLEIAPGAGAPSTTAEKLRWGAACCDDCYLVAPEAERSLRDEGGMAEGEKAPAETARRARREILSIFSFLRWESHKSARLIDKVPMICSHGHFSLAPRGMHPVTTPFHPSFDPRSTTRFALVPFLDMDSTQTSSQRPHEENIVPTHSYILSPAPPHTTHTLTPPLITPFITSKTLVC